MPGITRAKFTHSGHEVAVRNQTRALGSTIFFSALALGLTGGEINATAHGKTVTAVAVAPFIAVIFYAGWLVAWRTTVRLRPDGIIVENIFVRYTIPWGQGRRFYVSKGIRLRLIDGRTYPVWAFQGSLGSALIGYSAFTPIVDHLAEEGDRIVKEFPPEFPPPATRWRLQLPDWWVLLVVAGIVELFVWLTAAIR